MLGGEQLCLKDFVALAVFFFAFTSIIGNYSYAEGALTYLNINNKPCLFILRTLVLVFIVWGAREAITTVFDAADDYEIGRASCRERV